MKTKHNKRLTLYPSDRAKKILGESATDLNLSLEIFSDMIARETKKYQDAWPRSFWNFFADALNGFWPSESAYMNQFLKVEFEDAQKLDGKATKHGATGKQFDKFLDWLGEDADPIVGWCIIFGVRFFWNNYEKIDMEKDSWWTLEYRLDFK